MASRRMAVVMPRFPDCGMVGGAETLLANLAQRAAGMGFDIEVFTTCALDHVSRTNTLPPGIRRQGPLTVRFFAVDARADPARFTRIQSAISAGTVVSDADERYWLDHNFNSAALCAALAAETDRFERIMAGPYLFGLTFQAALLCPERTILVPCLHDEPFARLRIFRNLFHRVRIVMFNTEQERTLAGRLFNLQAARTTVTGMGLEPLRVTPGDFRRRHRLTAPYLLYCGRRETLKGTPLLLNYLNVFRRRTGRDVGLVLTGSGAIEPPRELCSGLLDLGFVAEAEKHAAMADCLAFCHPSTLESFGIVLMEAWLAGRPVLVHAGSDVLTDHCRRGGGGLWFRCYPEFEESLMYLLDHPELADTLGQQGRRYVESCYLHEHVDRRLAHALAL